MGMPSCGEPTIQAQVAGGVCMQRTLRFAACANADNEREKARIQELARPCTAPRRELSHESLRLSVARVLKQAWRGCVPCSHQRTVSSRLPISAGEPEAAATLSCKVLSPFLSSLTGSATLNERSAAWSMAGCPDPAPIPVGTTKSR